MLSVYNVRPAHIILSLLVLLPATAEAQARRPDGGVGEMPNINPDALREQDVDALMWPIVNRINQSGWVWTTESCQGHDGGYPLTLGVVTDQPGRFFEALFAAHADLLGGQRPDEAQVLVGYAFTCSSGNNPACDSAPLRCGS